MKIISLTFSAILVAAMGVFAQEKSVRVASYSTAVRLPGTASRVDDSNFLKPEFVNNLNLTAVRDFIKRYHEQPTARWYKTKDASLLVKFEESDIAYRVCYTSKGSWIYSIQTYYEKKMPRDVRAIVKSTYYDYAITQVEAIDHIDGAGTVYIIHIKDDSSWKTVRVCNSEMTELETLYKK